LTLMGDLLSGAVNRSFYSSDRGGLQEHNAKFSGAERGAVVCATMAGPCANGRGVFGVRWNELLEAAFLHAHGNNAPTNESPNEIARITTEALNSVFWDETKSAALNLLASASNFLRAAGKSQTNQLPITIPKGSAANRGQTVVTTTATPLPFLKLCPG